MEKLGGIWLKAWEWLFKIIFVGVLFNLMACIFKVLLGVYKDK